MDWLPSVDAGVGVKALVCMWSDRKKVTSSVQPSDRLFFSAGVRRCCSGRVPAPPHACALFPPTFEAKERGEARPAGEIFSPVPKGSDLPRTL